jgi:hypothetical protein
MRVALAIAATIAVPIRAAADEPAPAPTTPAPAPTTPAPAPTTPDPSGGPTFAPGGVPIPPTGTTSEPAPTTTATDASTTAPSKPDEGAPGADPAYGGRPDPDVRRYSAPRAKDVVIIAYPERSRTNIMWLGGLGGAGVVLGAVGLYFHLDSRSASNDVSENQFSGRIWTTERQDTYDRANRSAVMAGVFYGLGGALVLATAITYMVTEPKAETMTIHPHGQPTALVAPTRGGAIVGGGWSF